MLSASSCARRFPACRRHRAVDFTALRVERLRQRLEEARFAIELQSRRHVAVLAVGLTLGGGAAVSGLAGHVDARAAALAGVASAAIVLAQVRALARLARRWERENEVAGEVMETLMVQGDDHVPDA